MPTKEPYIPAVFAFIYGLATPTPALPRFGVIRGADRYTTAVQGGKSFLITEERRGWRLFRKTPDGEIRTDQTIYIPDDSK